MKNFGIMFGKEIKEFLRTYKVFVVPGLFLLFGFTSPIITKVLPSLLSSLAEEINFVLPEMTWVDSYGQFFKNLNQMGILAIILTTMGTIAEERNRGISQLVLTKPVPRTSYVLAKYAANFLPIAFTTVLAFFATWFYTDVLFPDTVFLNGLGATGVYIAYLAVILALVILASAMTKSAIAAGGLTVLGLIILNLLPLFSKALSKYSPAVLADYIYQVAGGTAASGDVWGAIACAAGTVIILLTTASLVFSRKEL
ncbi:MAG: ABC transporter permease [Bacillota bacterium]|jgi:ABC-2 type transport system permease protein|nr:ABC transporter permease [Bacillota bacterium]HOC06278.1 ABC-2 transporter permease [Bacillota bacterium]HPZ22000.1 ABC-2 transporter permease [Bacillota bacterium]HQD19784.1 ABC-2 transporter permease [Bacillota bacterium]